MRRARMRLVDRLVLAGILRGCVDVNDTGLSVVNFSHG